MFQIFKYIQFILTNNPVKRLKSNFIIEFVNQCFLKKENVSKTLDFQKFKQSLMVDKSTIKVTDLGAGSRIIKTNDRKVSDIAKNAGMSIKNASILINLIEYLNIKSILEIGTSVGLGTFCLANNKDVQLTTMEGCPNTLKFAKENLKKYPLKNIKFVEGNFDTTLINTVANNTYDLIYFDGNHQKQPTINYFHQCLDCANEHTIFIFDDIYLSKEMNEAWNYIKKHNKVSFTIDTFYWGIVFFRESEKKEHYKIKLA